MIWGIESDEPASIDGWTGVPSSFLFSMFR